MIIADQIELFYEDIREAADNSRIPPPAALARINRSRRSVAAKTYFYNVRDKTTDSLGVSTVVGGETSFTLLDTFLGLQNARDVVTRNGYPVLMKALAEWADITTRAVLPVVPSNETWGMLDGNTFYNFPAAVAGDIFIWNGAAEPPDLPAVTGPDVYLNNIQAQCCVHHAAIKALEDLKETPGAVLINEYKDLFKLIDKRGKPIGPRLETAPNL